MSLNDAQCVLAGLPVEYGGPVHVAVAKALADRNAQIERLRKALLRLTDGHTQTLIKDLAMSGNYEPDAICECGYCEAARAALEAE